MGDRGNIQITHDSEGEGGTIFLYTHWNGSDIPARLAHAFTNMEGREGDPSYATRIIFNALQGDDRSTTGFGIHLDQEGDGGTHCPHVRWNGYYGSPTIEHDGKEFTPAEFVAEFGKRMTGEKFLEAVRNS